MARLTDQQRQEFTSSYPDWTLDGETISRTFEFDDFIGSMGFVTKVAIVAEKANHHPDVDIRWNTVTLTLTTHDEGGLTQKDVDLAAQANRLA